MTFSAGNLTGSPSAEPAAGKAEAPPESAAHLLSDEQRRAFWAKVLAADPQAAAWAAKRPPRLAYDRADVVVRATHPGGGSTTATVHGHDLSVGGTSFLHHGYLHTNTTLALTLPKRLNGEEHLGGRVAWCVHVGGTWHAVGVRFHEPISPRPFVSPAEWDRLPSTNPIRPEMLAGQVLMIDDQDVDRLLFAHHLRATKLSITGVGTAEQAASALKGLVFDVVCLDLNLGVGRAGGEDAIDVVRRAGHQGPIVVISGTSAARLEAVRGGGRGVEHTLAKPYDADQLMATLAAALDVDGVDPANLVYSDLAQQDDTAELLATFCDKVAAAMRDFRRHVAAGNLDEVRLTCDMLRGSAGGYGYPAVSAAAVDALKALDATGDVGEASADLQKLAKLCKRLTPVKRARVA